ncbi:MJ1477/TM1410 family putative glycoside hydrolase [Histidinibacterium aquaticum]|uniref:MJ1477/TM1410 family putative glycoside hydrolase n=1 Tax=Histidinibacterium aquaticum TaxID=2613962 RepID=UPI00168B61A8|nr:MJ1477/TM1410 family putative glycoside hydrolase [Histidinibacterium aquaticum]
MAPAGSCYPEMNSWSIGLQGADPDEVAQSAADLVIIDYSKTGTDEGAYSPRDVRRMQTRPDGGRRLVLAYINVGEIETYRSYWQEAWNTRPPAWILGPNPNWPKHFYVRYWDPEWRNIILRGPDAFLNRIIDAGFDGVMVDGSDTFELRQAQRPSAPAEMVDLLAELADVAHRRSPGFLVIPNNAEGLVSFPKFLSSVDGLLKEDLYFGVEQDGTVNEPGMVNWSLERLDAARSAGLPVFLIEYLETPSQRSVVRERAAKRGYLLSYGSRDLSRLSEPVPLGVSERFRSPDFTSCGG